MCLLNARIEIEDVRSSLVKDVHDNIYIVVYLF